MATVEYLGGLPGHEAIAPVTVAVRDETLRLRHSRLFGGWSYRVPLVGIASAELATAREAQAQGLPAATGGAPGQPQGSLLTIVVQEEQLQTTIVLRGPWTMISDLRQEILRGRMRAAKQWHA